MKKPTINASLIKKLRKVKTLIKKGWCQGALARDKNGFEVGYLNRGAASYCLHAAATIEKLKPSENDFLSKAATEMGYLNEVTFNDHNDTTKADVLKFLDKCIERAKDEN
jgi:hypothetical protein